MIVPPVPPPSIRMSWRMGPSALGVGDSLSLDRTDRRGVSPVPKVLSRAVSVTNLIRGGRPDREPDQLESVNPS